MQGRAAAWSGISILAILDYNIMGISLLRSA